MKKYILSLLLITFFFLYAPAQNITTIAGTGTPSYSGDDGPAVAAGLFAPIGIAIDNANNIYITDTYNNRIRKINNSGIITTIAGNGVAGYNGDGIPATNAELNYPAGITCDINGNIFFADVYNNRVRKIDVSGFITTIAGNGNSGYTGDNVLADTTELNIPHSVVVDNSGNIYITDFGNHRIRKINNSGIISTIAGTGIDGNTGNNGPAIAAEISTPYGIIADKYGNVYFSDYTKNTVREINVDGTIVLFAGDGGSIINGIGDGGLKDTCRFSNPSGLGIDGGGNIYVADSYDNRIRKIDAVSNIITTVVGNGTLGFLGDNGPAINAELREPADIAIESTGTIIFTDFGNDRVRRVGWPEYVSSSALPHPITVFPNPSCGTFTIDIVSSTTEQAEIVITNALGETIKDISASTNEHITMQLNEPAGIYYLSAITQHSKINSTISIVR